MIDLKKNISIIGGDLRIVNLAILLKNDNWNAFIYGLEKSFELQKEKTMNYCKNLEEAIEKSNIIVSSIPLSKDENYVNAPYSEQKISIAEIKDKLINKTLIAGKIPEIIKINSAIECIDLLEIEEYAILNAIATAEGAIQIAMEEYPKTINGSNILIMGFGRIGKILAKMLQGLGANVYCEARKYEDLAYIRAYGYKPINFKDIDENLAKYDIIINNIPVLVLDSKRLNKLKKDVLVIDLASKPGGIDFEYAKSQNIKTIWALALPGKCSPVSAAEYIKEIIDKRKG